MSTYIIRTTPGMAICDVYERTTPDSVPRHLRNFRNIYHAQEYCKTNDPDRIVELIDSETNLDD